MSLVARLLLTFQGALIGGFLAGICVSLYEYATSKGVPLIGAAFIGIIVGFAYCILASIASFAGNVVWLALRPLASPYEPVVLPLLIVVIDLLLLSAAVRSSGFFEAGGRWFPAGVLLAVLLILFHSNGRNQSHG